MSNDYDQHRASNKCNERKILVLHTGGTIGMTQNSDGVLVLKSNTFRTLARKLSYLHDESYWNLRKKDINFDASFFVLPEMEELDCRIIYKILEYETLLVSPNMTENEWIRIARDIKNYYEEYDGFVILHGTDTMPYTASALSFMLENLSKCVIITGAQIPLFRPQSDGRDNFISSLMIAATQNIPEVTIFFSNNLYRGNRCRKVSTSKLMSFNSPNCEPLAEIEVCFRVNQDVIFINSAKTNFRVHDRMSRNIVFLKIFPNISAAVVRSILKPPVEGVVLETFAAGHMPSNREDLTEVFCKATRRGVIIVNITQCVTGAVVADASEDTISVKCGIIPGFDMTPEAALCKLSYVLTKNELSLKQKKEMMTANIRGELTKYSKMHTIHMAFKDIGDVLKIEDPKKLASVTSLVYNTLIMHSFDRSDLVSVQKLIEIGADLNITNTEGKSVINEAVQNKNIDTVEFLLKHGARINSTSIYGETTLLTAIHNDDIPMIDVLLKFGAQISDINTQCLSEIMFQAARRGSVKRLETLKRAGADFNMTDEMDQTPLHQAVICGNTRAIEYLVSNGARLDIEDVLGNVPNDYAEITQQNNNESQV